MRTANSHHFNLNPEFMARAAGSANPSAAEKKPVNSHDSLSDKEIILGYKENIEALREFMRNDLGKPESDNLDDFEKLIESGIRKNFTHEVLANYKTAVFHDFGLICTLAQDPDLPEDLRKETIRDLTRHFHLCTPGIAQHIEEAARKLQALKHGLPQNFINHLIQLIESQILDYMRERKICTSDENTGNEIHYAAAFFNHVAPNFGLPARADPFAPHLNEKALDEFNLYVYDKITIDHVIEIMAEDCRNQIIESYAKDHPNLRSAPMDPDEFGKVHIKFHDAVKPKIELAFGPILSTDIFNSYYEDDDEKYKLTIDNTLLMRSIARNLREARSISFDATYLAGEKGQGIKLKTLGENTVYVSTTDDNKQHHQEILEEFIWQDGSQSKELLEKLNKKVIEKTQAKDSQDNILQRISASAARRITQTADLENARTILTESIALMWSDTAREELLSTCLAQALRAKKPDIASIVLSEMGAQHLGKKDADGNTALHLALMNEYFEVANALIGKMSLEQFSIKNNNGHNCATIARNGHLTELSATLDRKIQQQEILEKQQRQLLAELRDALHSEDLQKAEILIGQMLPPTFGMTQEHGDTALMLAMYNDQIDIAGTIVANMSPGHFGIRNREGNTALMEAIQQLHPQLAESISKNMGPQQLDLQNRNGDTALMLALKMDDSSSASILASMANQDQLGLRNSDGDTALMIALRNNNFEIANLLTHKMSQKQLDVRNNKNNTALTIALHKNQVDLVDDISKKMSEKPLRERHDGLLQNLQKKLHSVGGGADIINQMLAQHLGITNNRGDTALMMALRSGHDDSSFALIAKMAPEQLGSTDKLGNTALMLALQAGKTEIASALMEKMPREQLHIRSRDGSTALMLALNNSTAPVCQYLIDNTNQDQLGLQDKFGNTALMIAQRVQKNETISAIIEKMTKEQLEIRNIYGTTAFIIARHKKQTDIARHIVKKINPPAPGFFTRIQLFFINMIPEKSRTDYMHDKLLRFYWY
ncbi:ankyrin repeat domain-containing protein [Pantoea sp. 18069]|uniref:ankyrin repeat domain-containing protein n=1 Tax=Pantoea sp. 18069 TaxID=2681415 RepID=UPI0013599C83|nr:ankyrin repeat domain-containing protein [Pantoea sp. 18069]